MFDPWRSLTNSPTLPWPDSDSSTDLRNKLFLVTTMATLSLRRFRNSWIWDERTLVRSAAAMTGNFSSRTCSSAIASFFHAATFRVVDIVLCRRGQRYLYQRSHRGFDRDGFDVLRTFLKLRLQSRDYRLDVLH